MKTAFALITALTVLVLACDDNSDRPAPVAAAAARAPTPAGAVEWTHIDKLVASAHGAADFDKVIVLKEAKPRDVHPLCVLASMSAEEIRDSGKPEAGEFKKVARDVARVCGL